MCICPFLAPYEDSPRKRMNTVVAAPRTFSYPSMGTEWAITIWDSMDDATYKNICANVLKQSQEFDATYSRFKKDSLIWSLTQKTGVVEVPGELVTMLRLYQRLNTVTKKMNPLVGFTLSDMGYDENYSLKPHEQIRAVPDFQSTLKILDVTHIELRESVLIDLGALGKGFFVDKISSYLSQKNCTKYLVNGSGDITYRGNGDVLRAGLEHPVDPTKAIGVVELRDGALCASASNRRRWANYHHTIDPESLTSPEEIIATWVRADSAALADGLATCLFLAEPELLQKNFSFEYCILNKDYSAKFSPGFGAELF